MACVLCFEEGTKARERLIDIFSEEGSKLNICSIISKHLWFKPENDFSSTQWVCWNCWIALRDFNIFYIRVAELHLTDWKYPSTCGVEESEQNKDPLPQETDLKYEEFREEGEKSKINDVSFEAEIKLEVQDLDDLPQVEVFEESSQERPFPMQSPKISESVSSVSNNKKKKSNQAETKKRRGRPRKNENDIGTSQAKSKKLDDIDVKNYVLLAVGEQSNVNLENYTKVIHDANSGNKSDKEVIAITSDTQLKRRGPPRKVKTSLSPVVKDRNEEDVNSTKPELPIIDNISDDYDNNVDADITTLHATEDSESSSTDSDDSDKSNHAQYAIIPKRKVVKPKKYRKRTKEEQLNALPRKPFTREELDAKKAEQEEYDRVIKKFFVRLACPVCELLVHNFTEVREHFRSSHNIEKGYLLCCGRKFVTRKLIAEHIYLHWNPEHFKCKTCGKACIGSRQLVEHEEEHVNPTKKKERKTYQCDQCQGVYSSKAVLQQHIHSKHIPIKEFNIECPECDKKFPTKYDLRNHKKKCHSPKIICDKCGKEMRTTYIKKHHELEHSEIPRPVPEPHQCQICGAWLLHMSGLKKHMRTIHEGPPGEHRCQICNKVSTNARALKRHIYLNHECERKFKCTMCEKAFKRPQDLREHTSTHTGEVLYRCPNCPMTFFCNANMHKHRQRLHRAEWEADRKKPKFLAKITSQADGATANL